MTTTYPHLLDRFQRVLVLAGAAVVCYIVAVLAVTSALGGFLVPALAGGVMFAVVIAAINKRTPPPSASPDAFADLALTTGMLNFAQVRVAGVGGLGLVILCALVTWQFPLIRMAMLAGAVGGVLGAVGLLLHHRPPRASVRGGRTA